MRNFAAYHFRWLCFALLVAARLPFLLLFFPGCLFGDTWGSIEQWRGIRDFTADLAGAPADVTIINHAPFLSTLIYGTTYDVGEALGAPNVAFGMLSLVQTVLLAWAITAVLVLLRRHGVGQRWLWAAVAAYALTPYYGVWSVELVKDSIMSVCAIALTYCLLRIWLEPQVLRWRELRGLMFLGGFAGVLLLFMMSKNQCPYIVVVLAAVVVVRHRRRWRVLAGVFASALAAYYIVWNGIVLTAFGVYPVGRQEMMGFMFQQTALCLKEHPHDLSAPERTAIDAVLPADSIAALYCPDLQDPVKFCFRGDATKEEVEGYVEVWAAMALRHPLTYVEALWRECDGYFVPMARGGRTQCDEPYALCGSGTFDTALPASGVHAVHDLPRNTFAFLQRMPVVGWVLNIGSLMCLFVALVLCAVVRRRTDVLVVMMPMVLQTLILVLSPEDGCHRYVMPILWQLPLYALLCGCLKGDGMLINEKKTGI